MKFDIVNGYGKKPLWSVSFHCFFMFSSLVCFQLTESSVVAR